MRRVHRGKRAGLNCVRVVMRNLIWQKAAPKKEAHLTSREPSFRKPLSQERSFESHSERCVASTKGCPTAPRRQNRDIHGRGLERLGRTCCVVSSFPTCSRNSVPTCPCAHVAISMNMHSSCCLMSGAELSPSATGGPSPSACLWVQVAQKSVGGVRAVIEPWQSKHGKRRCREEP